MTKRTAAEPRVEDLIDVDGERGTVQNVTLSPTAWRFVCSDADIPMIVGPRGGGKSTAAVARILRVANDGVTAGTEPPMECGAVRDSWVNLERTVLATLHDGVKKGWWDCEFYDQGRQAMLNDGLVHLNFFGMDRPADANKFQGYQAAMIWIDEPAPAADLASGVPSSVFSMGVSSLRQAGFKHSVQISMNPPDEDHWTIQIGDTLRDKGITTLQVEMFWVLPRENLENLPVGYREKMRAAFEADGRQDLVRRLVEGQVGSVQLGEAVTPGFSDLHIAKEPLPISMRWKTYRGWDLWMNPAMCMIQVTPSGHVHVVGALQAAGMGVEEFIYQHVLLWQTKYGILPPRAGAPDGFGRGARTGFEIEDVIDPSGSSPDQSSSKRSARKIIEQLLHTSCSPGPVAIDARVQSVNTLLGRMPGGRPMLQIDPVEGKPLIRALRGGWHRAKSPSGIIGPIVKNEACVPATTEILTAQGFRRFDQIQPGDAVYGFDLRRSRLVMDRIVDVHIFPGTREVMTWDSRNLSMAVTPDHRMVVCRGEFNHGGPIRWHEAELRLAAECNSTHAVPAMRTSARLGGLGVRRYTDDFVRLCAWIMTEGHYRKDSTNEIWIVQSAVHAEYCRELEKLALAWPSCAVFRWEAAGTKARVVLKHELAAMVRSLMPMKHPSPAMIHGLRQSESLLFLHEALKGDGAHHSGTLGALAYPGTLQKFWAAFPRGPMLCCANQAEADAVQHIALRAGIRAQIQTTDRHHSDVRVVLLRYRSYGYLGKMRRGTRSVDLVWCPETETGTWIARENGRLYPTGNSHVADAFGYLIAKLFPPGEPVARAEQAAMQAVAIPPPTSWLGR